MSASSGREDTATVAGSHEVTPNAREPIYMFSVSTTCTKNVETKETKEDQDDPASHLYDDPLPGQHGLGREHIAVTVLVLVPPRQPPPLHQSEVSIQYPPITGHLATTLTLWTNQR